MTEGRRLGKKPVLVYLFAEPSTRGRAAITPTAHAHHRDEIADFAAATAGAEVSFAAFSYSEWLSEWPTSCRDHAEAVIEHFAP